MFDCVRLAKFGGEFNQVRLPNPIEVNRTIGVRLGSITERLIGYAGHNQRPRYWSGYFSQPILRYVQLKSNGPAQ